MWIKTPSQIKSPVYQGKMGISEKTKESFQQFLESSQHKGPTKNISINEMLPIVSIGEPIVIPISELIPDDRLSPIIQHYLPDYDFYFFESSFSLKPEFEEFVIHQARYSLQFSSNLAEKIYPIAFTVHPEKIDLEIKISKKFVLSPSLKFSEFDLSLGEKEMNLEYTELKPVIIATGIGLYNPSWEYRPLNKIEIAGIKTVHVILKVKKNSGPIRASAFLSAKIKAYGFSLSAFIDLVEGEQEEVSKVTWDNILTKY